MSQPQLPQPTTSLTSTAAITACLEGVSVHERTQSVDSAIVTGSLQSTLSEDGSATRQAVPNKRSAEFPMDVDEPLDKKAKTLGQSLLEPQWRNNTSHASSPANSVYSESHESSSGRVGGARPATFLYTLCHFLNSNPASPYMRWAECGTYFTILDKDGLMRDIIPQLFSQGSYSSFARQLNIYGWRRLQTSPDGKFTNAHCTIWKHDDIYRNCPEDSIKNVKRNATDKHRRTTKGSQDAAELSAAHRARTSVIATTAGQALASRPRSESAPDRQRIASLTIRGPKLPQPGVFLEHSGVENRTMRGLPARSGITGNMLAGTASQLSLEDAPRWTAQLSAAGRQERLTHTRVPSDETVSDVASPDSRSAVRLVQAMPEPQRAPRPNNPVDVFVGTLHQNQAFPIVTGRDRIDVPVWIDPIANIHFVLAGDILRAWVLWDVLPVEALLFVMSADATAPPRPIGSATEISRNGASADPMAAGSRERIYLEAPSEPGAIGKCRLVYRSPASHSAEPLPRSIIGAPGLSIQQVGQVAQQVVPGHATCAPPERSPMFPVTPLQSGPPPMSSERRGPARSRAGSGPAASLPASLSSSVSTPTDAVPKTPHTADAVSSLALMQSLSTKTAIGIPNFDEGFAETRD